jgi:serine/threonine-protein kinase
VAHPEKLGKYRITEVLGEGAMGVVYKGFDPDIQRLVALKTIRQQLADKDDGPASIAARFRNEAQAAGRLMHPGIVAVYDFGRDQDIAYIAMEFVEGRSLASYLQARVRFTDTDIPGVMSQLLDALGHAHEKGVWHRDVKPANIIMTAGGRLKVADFGIARIEAAGLTQTHVMIGTPSHMAPEQFLGTPIDRRVDIYGAGVVLYQLLTGHPPFIGSTESLMYKVVHEPPAPPSTVDGANRPVWYDAIVARALAKKPDERFRTAEEFKQALVDAVGHAFDESAWDKTLLQAPARPVAPAAAAVPAPMPSMPSQGTDGPPRGDLTPTGGGLGADPPWGRSHASSSKTEALPTHWDKTQLAQAEASLAKHVGPLASVLVRRAARECHDIATLYAKLAEQVTDPRARNAFLGHATLMSGGATTGAGRSSASSTASAASASSAGLSEALLERAQALLAKRAAAQTDRRDVFFTRLSEAVTDPAARDKLMAELARLP